MMPPLAVICSGATTTDRGSGLNLSQIVPTCPTTWPVRCCCYCCCADRERVQTVQTGVQVQCSAVHSSRRRRRRRRSRWSRLGWVCKDTRQRRGTGRRRACDNNNYHDQDFWAKKSHPNHRTVYNLGAPRPNFSPHKRAVRLPPIAHSRSRIRRIFLTLLACPGRRPDHDSSTLVT